MKAYGYDWHQTLIGRIEAAQRPLRLNEAAALAALFGKSLTALTAKPIQHVEAALLEDRIERLQRDVTSLRQLEMEARREASAAADTHTAAAARVRAVEADLAHEAGRLAALMRQREQLLNGGERLE
jgi:hypothetical protein